MTIKTNQDKIAIFDLDNTLIDSRAKLNSDIKGTMERLGVQITPGDINRNWYEMAAGYGISKERFDQAFNQRKSWNQSLENGEVPIFSDTHDTLSFLQERGVKMALLSRSIPLYTDVKLDHFNLRQYFEEVETVHPNGSSKLEGARTLLDRLDLNGVKDVWCIGDKSEDVVIAEGIKSEYKLNGGGIYVDRKYAGTIIPEELKGVREGKYPLITSLYSVPGRMGIDNELRLESSPRAKRLARQNKSSSN